MPPRVRLTPRETERLPALLGQVAANRSHFPARAEAPAQAAWAARVYAGGEPLSPGLIALLLFEHGVHRSPEQVERDLLQHEDGAAILRRQPD